MTKPVLQIKTSCSSRNCVKTSIKSKLQGCRSLSNSVWMWYLEDLVGIAHGGDFVVGVGSSQLAQVTHGPSADFTVHVHLLHLVLRTHEHLRCLKNNSEINHGDNTHIHTAFYLHGDQKVAEVKQEEDLNLKSIETALCHFLKFLKIVHLNQHFFFPAKILIRIYEST